MRACTVCLKSPVNGISARFLRVNLFDAFQRRQLLDGLSALLFGQANFVEALQIQPELWARSEKMSQAQRRVSGDRALAVHDCRDAIRRNLKPTREFRGAHAERLKLLSQVCSGVNSPRCHGCSSVISTISTF